MGKGKKGQKRNTTPYPQQEVIFLSYQLGGSIFPFQMGLELLVGLMGILSLSGAQWELIVKMVPLEPPCGVQI